MAVNLVINNSHKIIFFSLTSQEVYFKYKTMQRLKAIMNVLIMLRFINLLNCSVATNQGVL